MTTYTEKRNETATLPMFASLGAGVSVVLTAVGTFWDLTNNETGEPDGFVEFLPVIGIIAVATALVFGLVARRPTPVKSLVLGVLSVLSIAVFWAGLPAVFAAASLACAVGSERRTAPAKTGIVLSILALGGAVILAIAG